MAAEDLQSGSSTLTKPPLSPSPSPFTQNGNPKDSALRKTSSSNQKTPMWEQKSLRRSPRLLENGEESDGKYTEGDDFKEPKKRPAKQNPRPKKQKTSELPSKKSKGVKTVSFLIGDPVPDKEARKRWPWRYDDKVHFKITFCSQFATFLN